MSMHVPALGALAAVMFAAMAAALPTLRDPGASADPWTCDPIQPDFCGFPFPSDFYLSEADSQGRRHVNITKDAVPKDIDGQGFDVNSAGFPELDGFSPMPVIQVFFRDLDTAGMANWTNPELSLLSTSPTLLINTATGQPVAHWVELDVSAELTKHPAQALLMYPAVRLNDTTRYVVGFRNLKDTSGHTISASTAFQALRDNLPSEDPTILARRTRFDKDVFQVLVASGVQQLELTLAWDFTVSSTKAQTGFLLSMRDDAMQRITQRGGIEYRILQRKENPRDNIARELHGLMRVPWYLNQVEPGVGTRLVRDPSKPWTADNNGDGWVEFEILIPSSLANGTQRGAIMQYGHGLFGSAGEINTGYLDTEANERGYVLAATNWLGMSYEDEVFVALMMASDLSNFPMVPERSHQGLLNALLLMELVSSDKFINDPAMQFNGSAVVNPEQRYYYGNSQGGIFGTVYMAMTQSVKRGVIGVGGGPYGLLLPRSSDFAALFDVLRVRYPEHLDRIFLLSLLQALWDKAEPAGYLHHISKEPLPNTPVHTILAHYGLGDEQVSNLGTMAMARSVGATMFTSNVRQRNESLWGFPKVADTAVVEGEGNHVVQGWNFGAPPIPVGNVPPADHGIHEKPRRSPQAQQQTYEFLTSGRVTNFCHGPCNE